MSTITIVLADDHQVVRQGFRVLLEEQPDFRVIGEAGNGVDAIRLTENLRPNVLVVDVLMPKLKGIEVVYQLRRRAPETRIIVLSMYADDAYVFQAFRNGVLGYVLKDSSAASLVKAVREVHEGRRFLSPPLSESKLATYALNYKQSSKDVFATLTPREREVMQLGAEGLTCAEIARRLSISPRTVEVHRANMLRKLQLKSQTDLVRYAIARGLSSVNEPNLARKS
jgi:two-component system response regulator NreC